MTPSFSRKQRDEPTVVEVSARENKLGRPADRQEVILESLRGRIVAGELVVGQVLPTRSEIQKEFDASPVTVQRALERLKRDGYVTATRGNGTFVSSQAPHLTRFAVVFAMIRDPWEGWSNFHEALSRVASSMTEEGPYRVPQFYDVSGYEDSAGYRDLLEDIREHRLAGVLFVSMALRIQTAPILRRKEVPCMLIGTHDCGTGLPMVHLDGPGFWNKALDRLKEQGCRNVAALVPPGQLEWRDTLEAGLRARGMMTRSHWWQVAHAKAMESSYQVISLLFNKMNGDLPDALIIADDNLVEGATQALADSGAQDVKVMAHCNFPLPAPAGYPVERVGFDARELLRVCIQTMAAHNAGEPMPEEVLIPARLEEELT